MTPFFLQQAIIKRLEGLFGDYRLKKCGEEDMYTGLNIYCQTTPIRDNQAPEEFFPYILVQLDEGGMENGGSPQNVTVFLIIGVYDESFDNHGHQDVLNIIEKIHEGLFSNRLIDGRYYIEYPFKWNLSDEDRFPFYFGGIETHWAVPTVIKTYSMNC